MYIAYGGFTIGLSVGARHNSDGTWITECVLFNVAETSLTILEVIDSRAVLFLIRY